MKFFTSAAAILAFAASAFAQTADFDPIFTPASGEVVPAGKTFQITWSAPPKYANQKITISLIGGATQGTQVPLVDIASGVDNSAESYSWAVDASLGAENVYGLVFKLESDPSVFQYSNPFKIDGPAEVKPSSSSASASGTTTLTATHGVKTVTLSSSSSSVSVVSTDVVILDKTTTVPCNNTVPATSTTHIVKPTSVYANSTTLSTSVPVVTPTAVAPTTPGVPSTPAAVPTSVVTAGAARLGGSVAAVAGLVLAAFAL